MTNLKEEKCLVAYFSREGNNYVSGKIVNLPVGNTKVVADMLWREHLKDSVDLLPALKEQRKRVLSMELVPGTLGTSKEAKQWNRHMKWEKRFDRRIRYNEQSRIMRKKI